MFELEHTDPASVFDALTASPPKLSTVLDLIDPIRHNGDHSTNGDPRIVTDLDIARLKEIIGTAPTSPNRHFQTGVRFIIPQDFDVNGHRHTLAAIIQKTLEGGGEVVTRTRVSSAK